MWINLSIASFLLSVRNNDLHRRRAFITNERMKSTPRGKRICMVIAMLGCGRILNAQEISPRMAWENTDHPCGIYHAKDSAHLSVRVDNPSTAAFTIHGFIAFGILVTTDEFKVISVTPVNTTEIAAGQSASIPLTVNFAGAGTYELRWMGTTPTTKGTPIDNADGVLLNCIFAPRPAAQAARDGRWLATLPRQAANVPGYLPDLIKQTGVSKYLLDERFAFDSATGIALGVGESLHVSSEQVDRLFTETAGAHAELVLRLTVPMAAAPDDRTLEAFRQYIVDGIRRSHGSLAAIIIAPENGQTDRAAFRAVYLAGYAAAKSADKKILMLGAGSANSPNNSCSPVMPPSLNTSTRSPSPTPAINLHWRCNSRNSPCGCSPLTPPRCGISCRRRLASRKALPSLRSRRPALIAASSNTCSAVPSSIKSCTHRPKHSPTSRPSKAMGSPSRPSRAFPREPPPTPHRRSSPPRAPSSRRSPMMTRRLILISKSAMIPEPCASSIPRRPRRLPPGRHALRPRHRQNRLPPLLRQRRGSHGNAALRNRASPSHHGNPGESDAG